MGWFDWELREWFYVGSLKSEEEIEWKRMKGQEHKKMSEEITKSFSFGCFVLCCVGLSIWEFDVVKNMYYKPS